MKTNHTRGAWAIVERSDAMFIVSNNDSPQECLAQVFREDEGGPLPVVANARLIAAAPEILSALEYALDFIKAKHEQVGKAADVRMIDEQAIKKARGEK